MSTVREHLEKKPQLPAKWLWSAPRPHPEIRTDWVRLNRAGRGFHGPDIKGALRPPQVVDFKKWWVEMDSNQRKLTLADLQSAPFSHSGIYPFRLRGADV